jgi:hypothetical protein
MANFLNPGTPWYPSLAPVDADSFAFKAVIAWIKKQVPLTQDPVIVYPEWIGSTMKAPAELEWTSDSGKKFSTDAVLSFYFPRTDIPDLQEQFGLRLAIPPDYVAPHPPAPPPPPPAHKPDPVGDLILSGPDGHWYKSTDVNHDVGDPITERGVTYLFADSVAYGAMWWTP